MGTTGIKHDDGKLRWSLLPFRQMESVIRVLEHGADKYSVDNWKEIDNAERRYFDASMRHLISFRDGELNDKESELPHLSHAICCLLFLLWHSTEGHGTVSESGYDYHGSACYE